MNKRGKNLKRMKRSRVCQRKKKTNWGEQNEKIWFEFIWWTSFTCDTYRSHFTLDKLANNKCFHSHLYKLALENILLSFRCSPLRFELFSLAIFFASSNSYQLNEKENYLSELAELGGSNCGSFFSVVDIFSLLSFDFSSPRIRFRNHYAIIENVVLNNTKRYRKQYLWRIQVKCEWWKRGYMVVRWFILLVVLFAFELRLTRVSNENSDVRFQTNGTLTSFSFFTRLHAKYVFFFHYCRGRCARVWVRFYYFALVASDFVASNEKIVRRSNVAIEILSFSWRGKLMFLFR